MSNTLSEQSKPCFFAWIYILFCCPWPGHWRNTNKKAHMTEHFKFFAQCAWLRPWRRRLIENYFCMRAHTCTEPTLRCEETV